jgi:hypothetical protein
MATNMPPVHAVDGTDRPVSWRTGGPPADCPWDHSPRRPCGDRGIRRAGCPYERPDDPLRLVPRPVTMTSRQTIPVLLDSTPLSSAHDERSPGARRHSQPTDPPQDRREQRPEHHHLGHLERDGLGVADDLDGEVWPWRRGIHPRTRLGFRGSTRATTPRTTRVRSGGTAISATTREPRSASQGWRGPAAVARSAASRSGGNSRSPFSAIDLGDRLSDWHGNFPGSGEIQRDDRVIQTPGPADSLKRAGRRPGRG